MVKLIENGKYQYFILDDKAVDDNGESIVSYTPAKPEEIYSLNELNLKISNIEKLKAVRLNKLAEYQANGNLERIELMQKIINNDDKLIAHLNVVKNEILALQ